MAREVDVRQEAATEEAPEREAELVEHAERVSEQLPGDHEVRVERVDPVTGNPAVVASVDAPAEIGNYVQRALDHVQSIGDTLGLAAGQAPEFAPDPQVQETTTGARAVNLQQLYKGIPIYDAARTVVFSADGAIDQTLGTTVTIADDRPVSPSISVREAVKRAGEYVATPDEDEQNAVDQFGEPLRHPKVDLKKWEPTAIASFNDDPQRKTVFEAGPFGDEIKADLIWFPVGNKLRLAWEVLVALPEYAGFYRTLVDANSGDILLCVQQISRVAARGNVFRSDPGQARQMVDFPPPLAEHGIPLPAGLPQGFPDTWVEASSAAGNCAYAHAGDSGPTYQGNAGNGTIVFDPDPDSDDQKILNVFYFNCMLHDAFYLLGFTERDGNFQRDNLGRGGLAGDRVDARVYPGPVWGTASMGTPVDGSSPVMKMGLVTRTDRHTGVDASVVFHEFTHGVTNRLVGGPANARALEAPQSAGMGEGWSDYIACTFLGTDVVGSWVVNNLAGIRSAPYDANYPLTFADIAGITDEHDVGEVWAATLLELNRRIGTGVALQLVVDALKLTPANPSFLDARDAILTALRNRRDAGRMSGAEYAAAYNGAWAVFARFGLGPNARSNGAFLTGINADFNAPPHIQPPPGEEPPPTEDPTNGKVELAVEPRVAIPDRDARGITNSLTVDSSGRVKKVSVSVDIAHTYIGDLRVSLVGPRGGEAVLHNRAGASTDNLVRTYASDDVATLGRLTGASARGDWTLKVADLASRDTGTLRAWGLSLELEPAASTQTARGEARPAVRIPDDDPSGVESTIAIGASGTARSVKVTVDITHTYVGDLVVELVSPSGNRATLHDRLGGSRDNLIRSYDSVATPALAALIGSAVQGNWKLRVADHEGQDVGKLNGWALELSLS
jgi:extracellular elastinolytic metalloproteinase